MIVKLVEKDPKKRLLSLHALKEVTQISFGIAPFAHYGTVQVVTHCSHGQLEGVADTLWVPLFENSENAEETTRNVAAACLGKLATTHPSKYLPQLHVRESSPVIYSILTSESIDPHTRREPRYARHRCRCDQIHVCGHYTILRRGFGTLACRFPIRHD